MMLWKFRQYLQVKIKLTFCHGLYDKLLVMAEEKEATRASCSLSSFEDHVTVELWTETCMKHLVTFQVIWKRVIEGVYSVVSYTDIFIYDQIAVFDSILWLLICRCFSRIPLLAILYLDMIELHCSIASSAINRDSRFSFTRDHGSSLNVSAYISELCYALEDDIDQLNVKRRSKHQVKRLQLQFRFFLSSHISIRRTRLSNFSAFSLRCNCLLRDRIEHI